MRHGNKWRQTPIDDTIKEEELHCHTTYPTLNQYLAHFVHCTANSARTAAMSELLTTMKDTEHHPFGITIAASLDRYLTSPDAPVDIPYTNKLKAQYHEPIREALDDQQRIGWLHFLRGFTSLSWLYLESINALDSQKSDRKRGEHRIHTLLQALHTFSQSLWLGRNEALHCTKETTDAAKFNADSAEIRLYFDNPNMLPAEDRHYCAHNMTKLLRSRPSVRRRWLQRVRTARSNMLKHGRSQLTMTKYYALDPQATHRHGQTEPKHY